MSKVTLVPVTGAQNTSAINDNFAKVAEALNDDVLYRDNPAGEPNLMKNDLDMNGKRIYNLPTPIADNEAARLGDLKDKVVGGSYGKTLRVEDVTINKIPDKAVRANRFLSFDSNGDPQTTTSKGTIPELSSKISNSVLKFTTRADAINAISLMDSGQFVEIVADESYGNHPTNNSLTDGSIVFSSYGSDSIIGGSDSSYILDEALKGGVRLSEGDFNVNSTISRTSEGVFNIKGLGKSTKLLKNNSTGNQVIRSFNNSQTHVEGLNIELSGGNTSTTGMTLDFSGTDSVVVGDVSIKGFAGTGSGVINYTSLDSVPVTGVRYRDCKFEGVYDQSVNTNGFLIEDAKYSFMTGLHASGAKAFGIEYKNNSIYNIIGNSIGSDSVYSFGYGQTTVNNDGVDYSSASNMVSHNSQYGWILGEATYNFIGNGVIHNNAATSRFNASQTHGIRLQINSVGNLVSNMLFAGDMFYPVRYDDSENNFVSGAFHTSNFVTTLGSGARRNVTEVQHPGLRNTILNTASVNDASGNTALSGPSANPVYCHALGEYRGSMSGRWRWMHDTSGIAAITGNRKWVFEAKGDSFVDVMTDGSGVAGYSVTGPSGNRQLQYNYLNNEWRLTTGGTEVRLSSSQIAPSVTETMTLGNSVLNWSNIYSRNITLKPPASATPANAGEMTFELASDTLLRIKVKGSDGVTRTAALTLT